MDLKKIKYYFRLDVHDTVMKKQQYKSLNSIDVWICGFLFWHTLLSGQWNSGLLLVFASIWRRLLFIVKKKLNFACVLPEFVKV